MTFYEAAVEVLREAGRPLHFKKITEISIRRSLLSHVGKTPEITMGARLNQEIRKSDEGTLITEVRPGVFALKEGSDPTEARETLRLRESVPDDEDDDGEEEEITSDLDVEDLDDDSDDEDDDDSDDGDDDDDSDSDGESDDNGDGSERARGGRRRRRRGRRGGRNRQRRSDDDDSDNTSETGGDGDDSAAERSETRTPAAAPAPQSDAPERRAPRARRPRNDARTEDAPARSSAPAETTSDSDSGLAEAGEFARQLLAIFEEEQRDMLSLRQLSAILARREFGAAGRLDPAIIRGGLLRANQRRTAAGWPPLFVEVRPERWALATASGQELGDSYTALAAWQRQHRGTLRNALATRLRSLDGDAAAAVVTLLLERLGHRDLQRNEKLGREHSTISATLQHGLTSSRVAVRIANAEERLTREDVIAFRGSLHNYRADDGAIVSVAGFEGDARSEAVVPNLPNISLIGADELADKLIDSGVGVESFRVDVSCIDESFFRAFGGDDD